jgi:hypothetical protein
MLHRKVNELTFDYPFVHKRIKETKIILDKLLYKKIIYKNKCTDKILPETKLFLVDFYKDDVSTVQSLTRHLVPWSDFVS